MALEYGFTNKEKENYYQPTKVYSSFGKDFTNDYIALHVYDLSDVLLTTKIMLKTSLLYHLSPLIFLHVTINFIKKVYDEAMYQ